MALVADFRVVNDAARKVRAGENAVFACEIPPNLSHGGQQPKSLLLVKFRTDRAVGLSWEIYLNGALLLATSGSGSSVMTTVEAFEANIMLRGENELEVRVTQGEGALWIADTVLHYHITI